MIRSWLHASQIAIDLTVLTLALCAGFLVRFDGDVPIVMTARLALTGPYVVIFEYMVLLAFGVHRFSWRYVGLREIVRIAAATATVCAVLVVIRLALGKLQYDIPYLRHGVVPLGVLAVNGALMFLGLSGVRVTRRLSAENRQVTRRRSEPKDKTPTLLVGAGQGGVIVARELSQRPDLGIAPLGFIDDDTHKIGEALHGVRVLGTSAELPALVKKHGAEQVLITMSNVAGQTIRRIHQLCEDAGVTAKIVPGLDQILGGSVSLSRVRPVAIEDLLRREPVTLDEDAIRSYIEGSVVMITGAGGSIGSELCRQVLRLGPAQLVLVERAENNLFCVHRELLQSIAAEQLSGTKQSIGADEISSLGPEDILPCIADVRDEGRMRTLFERLRPAVVLHAAAHKHVPMMEQNPAEAVKNNLFGTQCVAALSAELGVEVFVMVSTDKAVNPSSVMGATKRAAEIYVQALAQTADTRFVTVRFGNVLDSAGSVVPIFKEQIARGGPVTVTHPEMRRYFMTIPEACQLVLQAASMGNGGEIFVLDMGEPVKIVDLAKDLIELSGLRVGEDVEIVFSGIRPGEKLFEELNTEDETTTKTAHPKIVVANTKTPVMLEVNAHLATLLEAAENQRDKAVVKLLHDFIPEFTNGEAESASTRDLSLNAEDAEQSGIKRLEAFT